MVVVMVIYAVTMSEICVPMIMYFHLRNTGCNDSQQKRRQNHAATMVGFHNLRCHRCKQCHNAGGISTQVCQEMTSMDAADPTYAYNLVRDTSFESSKVFLHSFPEFFDLMQHADRICHIDEYGDAGARFRVELANLANVFENMAAPIPLDQQ